jgi:hypothetical protein
LSAVTLDLIHPITQRRRIAGAAETTEETITEVDVRRINGGDIRWLETMKGKPGATLGLLARVTGLKPDQVDQLDAEDISAIGEVIEGFLPASLKGGEGNSAT